MRQITKYLLILILAMQFVSLHSMVRPQGNRAVKLQKLIVERNNKLKWAALLALTGIASRESPWNEGLCPCPAPQTCAKNMASLWMLIPAASLALSAAYTHCLIWQHS